MTASYLSGFLTYGALLHTTWFHTDVLRLEEESYFPSLHTYATDMTRENYTKMYTSS
jgi:hypothetical protein